MTWTPRVVAVLSLYRLSKEWQKKRTISNMSRTFFYWGGVLLLLAAACVPTRRQPGALSEVPSAMPTSSGSFWPGKRPDGSVLLPNQWSLRPVGRQIELGDFPVNIAAHPD